MNKMTLLIGAGGIAIGTILGAGLKDHLSALLLLHTNDQSANSSVTTSPEITINDSVLDVNSPFRATADASGTGAFNSPAVHGKGSAVAQTLTDLHRLSDYQLLLRTLQYIDTADGAALTQLVEQREKMLVHQPASIVVVQAIFQRWAQVDVAALIEWMNVQVQPESTAPSQYHAIESGFLMEAVTGMVQASPDRANEWLASILDEQLRQMLSYRVMSEMGRQNPAAALAKLIDDENDMGNRYSIISEWAYADPQAAFAWIQINGGTEERAELESMVFSAWLERDPDAAMAEIERLPDSPEKGFLRARYAGMLAASDPAMAFQTAVDMAQGDLQSLQSSLGEIVWQWAESDLDGLRQRIESESDPAHHALFLEIAGPQIASSMMYEDPLAAMNWIDTLPATQQRGIKPQVFQEWVSLDKEAAIAWLQQQPAPGDSQLNAAVIWHLPESHLDFALSLFPSLERPVQSSVVNQMVYQLHSQQPHLIEGWIAGIHDPQVKQIAQSAKEGLSALADVDESIAQLEYLEGEEKIDRLFELFQALSMIEPDRIEHWMHDHPLTMTEQRMLEQRFMDQSFSSVGFEGCPQPYLPGSYDASTSIRY